MNRIMSLLLALLATAMALGSNVASAKNNTVPLGNLHQRSPVGDFKVEGAGVRASTLVTRGTTAKQVVVGADAEVNPTGWVERTILTEDGETAWDTSWDEDIPEDAIVQVVRGPGYEIVTQLAASEAVAVDDYGCADGTGLIRRWVPGTDPEAARVCQFLQASNVASVAKVAVTSLI